MESEKVKVIKEYLRCMRGEKACWDCGLNEIAENQDTCCINLVADMALDLINELESENERLILQYERVKADSEMNCLELKDRIAELENKKEDLLCKEYKLIKYENEIKAKTLEQFAERLKEKLEESNFINNGLWLVDTQVLIDETLKEYYQKNG